MSSKASDDLLLLLLREVGLGRERVEEETWLGRGGEEKREGERSKETSTKTATV